MNYFTNSSTLEKISFNLFDNQYLVNSMTDEKAVSIIYDLYRLLDAVHFKRIILGDIKPANILVDLATFKPILCDIDSAQVPPNYPCTAISDAYLDYRIAQQGKNSDGYYLVSTDSDIFSLAVVCYEFFVGMLPYDISIEPALTEIEAKNQGVNLLVFHKHKLSRLRSGFELQKNENCLLALQRLDLLEQKYKELYEFFCTVLVFDKRQYLIRNKKHAVKRLDFKRKKFASQERKYNKKDPIELLELLKSYNIDFKQ